MFGRRRQRPSGSTGLRPDTRDLTGQYAPGVQLYAPMGTVHASEQVGRYGRAIPTQYPAMWPGLQLKAGVEGLVSRYAVIGAGDLPYWIGSPVANASQVGLQRSGSRVTQLLGPAQTSAILGPQRQSLAQQIQAMASGLMGW